MRSTVAFGAGLLLVGAGVGAATLAVAFAQGHDSLGIDHELAFLFGVPGAAAALAGGGLLWLGGPIRLRAEPLVAHPGVGEPPP